MKQSAGAAVANCQVLSLGSLSLELLFPPKRCSKGVPITYSQEKWFFPTDLNINFPFHKRGKPIPAVIIRYCSSISMFVHKLFYRTTANRSYQCLWGAAQESPLNSPPTATRELHSLARHTQAHPSSFAHVGLLGPRLFKNISGILTGPHHSVGNCRASPPLQSRAEQITY